MPEPVLLGLIGLNLTLRLTFGEEVTELRLGSEVLPGGGSDHLWGLLCGLVPWSAGTPGFSAVPTDAPRLNVEGMPDGVVTDEPRLKGGSGLNAEL